MIEASARGKPLGELGHFNGGKLAVEHFDKIVRCCFAFDVRAQSKDQLLQVAGLQSSDELVDPKIFGPDIFQGSQPASETMVVALEGAGPVECKNIGGLFDNTKCGLFPCRIIAQGTLVASGLVESTKVAALHGSHHAPQPLLEIGRNRFIPVQQPDHDPFRASRTDSRQSLESGNEILDLVGEIGAVHLLSHTNAGKNHEGVIQNSGYWGFKASSSVPLDKTANTNQ